MAGRRSLGPRLAGTNLKRAGDHNQRVTLHAIRVNGPVTRGDLAELTGLTPPAIANITRRLIGDGLVLEADQKRGGRGQPATRLVINDESAYSIGVNVDRDHITIVVVDFVGKVRARTTREIAFALPGEVQSFYRKSIGKLIEQGRIDIEKLVGIGVALPDDLAAVDLPGRPKNYAQWESARVSDLFVDPLDLPIFVENDAAAAAMGELQLGLGHRYRSFFYVLISMALGGGVVADGVYLRGADGRSGEIGFLLVEDGLGGSDQLQNIVSLGGLATRLAREGSGLDTLHAVSRLPASIEMIVDEWIEAAALALVQPLIAVNCLINPTVVLIGGRLPAGLVSRLAERINVLLRTKGGNAPVIAPVEKAALSDDAPAVGAAILPFSHFLLPRPSVLLKSARAISMGGAEQGRFTG